MEKFILVQIDSKYCDYLRKFDRKVAYNFGYKELRPFIGVLFKVGKIEYFAPLSSPKKKHLSMHDFVDFVKIDKGRLGAINFNNMIPVLKETYQILDMDLSKLDTKMKKYYILLGDQLFWLNRNYYKIVNKAYILYNKYTENRLSKQIKDRCCNFPLLEEKCLEYKKSNLETMK